MPEEKKKPEIANIDENGEIVINDSELAKMTEELTQDELDEVAGGLQEAELDGNFNCGCGAME